MPDAISGVIKGIDALQAEMRRIDKNVDRATMWAVREAGRQVKREAMREAPVYKGADARRRPRKGEATPTGNRPVSGLLKASIHSSRRLGRHGDGTYSVRVAPRGQRVHLYSQKVEALHDFMVHAHDAVAPQLRAIAERAWTRATRGRR